MSLVLSSYQPSQVGIALDSIAFSNYFGATYLGPAASEGSFNMAPLSTIGLPLVGRLVPQNDSSGLADVSTIFNNFIHGKDSNVTVYGDTAGPSDVRYAMVLHGQLTRADSMGLGDMAEPSYKDIEDRDVAPESRGPTDHH